ncbi:MAG TPA: ABC transporter permease [Bacillota bacterium]|nr:ABC transporter permease [Bacillota bacterium]HOL10670.1 ABC transporter permease [Bacillota bacterium]HPO98355.1 ABC transporter permease [Bacillota bacterium]
MKYSIFALKNLTQRKIRTFLTILSIAAAVAVLFTLLSFNQGYEVALKEQLQQMGVHIMAVPMGCPFESASLILKGGQIPAYMEMSVLEQISRIDGVQIAAPVLMHGLVRPEEGRTDIYLGIDERTIQLKNWWKLNGSFFQSENEMILGYNAALVELAELGDEIYIPEYDRTFRVVGILESTGTQDDGFFYIPLQTAQQLFDKPQQITGIQIRVNDPALAEQIAMEMQEIEGINVLTMSELMGTMLNLMGSAKTLIFSIVLIAIVISALGVLNTVLMSVFERTKEIGIMKATGASKRHVFTLIWLETLTLSLIGGVLGILIALIGARNIEIIVKQFLPITPNGSVVSLDLHNIFYCILFILAIGVFAGLYPAYQAANANPIQALKTE